ncbi:MAG: hypothetical protein ACM3H8_10330 [Sphingobacteriales bacterium]
MLSTQQVILLFVVIVRIWRSTLFSHKVFYLYLLTLCFVPASPLLRVRFGNYRSRPEGDPKKTRRRPEESDIMLSEGGKTDW